MTTTSQSLTRSRFGRRPCATHRSGVVVLVNSGRDHQLVEAPRFELQGVEDESLRLSRFEVRDRLLHRHPSFVRIDRDEFEIDRHMPFGFVALVCHHGLNEEVFAVR